MLYLSFAGSLYFANVMMSDRREGKMYVCNLQNTALRTFSQGGDQIIIPRPTSEVAEEEQETGSGDADDQPGTVAIATCACLGNLTRQMTQLCVTAVEF